VTPVKKKSEESDCKVDHFQVSGLVNFAFKLKRKQRYENIQARAMERGQAPRAVEKPRETRAPMKPIKYPRRIKAGAAEAGGGGGLESVDLREAPLESALSTNI